MHTIFMYTTKMEFLEDMKDIKEERGEAGFNAWARHELCWFNPEDLDEQFKEAFAEMDLSMNYIVAVDWDFNIVREHTRKD